MAKIEKTETLVKYQFSQDELINIGEMVADCDQQLADLEAEFGSIKKQYAADIESKKMTARRFLNLIRDKYEMRTMEVFKFISGKHKRVWFFRCDEITNEQLMAFQHDVLVNDIIDGVMLPPPVKEREARASELQSTFPMDKPESKPE